MTRNVLCSLALLAALGSTACGNCGPDSAARGSASIAWSITTLDRPATCAQVGAVSVSLQLRSRAGTEVTTAFACTDSRGITSPVSAGAYDAILTLHAADGTTIASGPTQFAVTIGAGQVTVLMPVTFTTSGRGKLSLSISTLSTRANCLSRDQGGGGVTANQITLEHLDGTGCAAVTFTRWRGDVVLGTYTVDCGRPVVGSCIERDERLTVDDVKSGLYVISVHALSGPRRCWFGVDVLSVPADTTLVQRIQLAPQLMPGC